MAGTRPDGYSAMQIMLHWSVATLVVFQFFVNDGIAEAWRGFARGETVDEGLLAAANVHVIIGITILALALWRIALRFSRGAPPPPENEPPVLRRVAEAADLLLHVLIVVAHRWGGRARGLGGEASPARHRVAGW